MNRILVKSDKKTVYEALGRNSIHPFPARMAPGIALEALGNSKKSLRVLDPMVGSGTVLAVARANGHQAIGVDLDPLAVLLAGVWTSIVDVERVKSKASEVLKNARINFKKLSVRNAYPIGGNDETREFVRFWFDAYTRRQLAALSKAIRGVEERAVRNVLWCGFSRLIITKKSGVSLAMDLSHSRPHKKFERAPVKPFNKFLDSVNVVVSNCHQGNGKEAGPNVVVRHGDARQLNIANASIDLVLTSPPYLNAIDYMRCSKFSLVWMGYGIDDLRKIRGSSVGANASLEVAVESEWVKKLIKELKLSPALSNKDEAILSRYIWDMSCALSEVSRVLRLGGRAVYVVGDSNIRGTFVRNSSIVASVAKSHGLSMIFRRSRQLPANRRYLPPPKLVRATDSLSGRMRREVVMVFKKPKSK